MDQTSGQVLERSVMEVVLCSNPITAEEEKLWQILRLNTDLIMSRWSELCPQVAVGVGVQTLPPPIYHNSASHPLVSGQFGKLNDNFFGRGAFFFSQFQIFAVFRHAEAMGSRKKKACPSSSFSSFMCSLTTFRRSLLYQCK